MEDWPRPDNGGGARRRQIDHSLVAGLASLTVAATILRLPSLAGGSFWFDEWFTHHIVDGSLLDLARFVKGAESTPPLYYGIAWLWANVFGAGEIALRSLSILFGVATVPVAYFAGSTLVTPRAGWFAAAFVATSPLLVWYSTEARAYSLLVFLGAVSLLLVARALRMPTRRRLLLWSLSAALALATHYFSAFLIAGEIVVLLAYLPGRRRAVLTACIPVGVTAVLLAPLLYLQRGHGAWIQEYPLASRLDEVGRNFVSGVSIPSRGLEVLATSLALTLVVFALLGSTEERRAARVMLTVGVVSLAVPIVLALIGGDYVLTRNVIASWLPVALVGAIGGASRRFGRAGFVLASLFVAVSLVDVGLIASDERLQRVDWKGAARLLGEARDDRLVIAWGDYRLAPLEERLRPAERLGGNDVVQVAQIDILGFRRPSGRISCWSGAACNMVPVRAPSRSPAAGFALRERLHEGLFEVNRFQAAEGRRIRISDVLQSLSEARTPSVWWQAGKPP